MSCNDNHNKIQSDKQEKRENDTISITLKCEKS